jgi:hypothetical protein
MEEKHLFVRKKVNGNTKILSELCKKDIRQRKIGCVSSIQ